MSPRITFATDAKPQTAGACLHAATDMGLIADERLLRVDTIGGTTSTEAGCRLAQRSRTRC